MSSEDTEVFDGHDCEALLERASLAEDDDVGPDTFEGRGMYLSTIACGTVLRVAGAERGQDFGRLHLLPTDG